jgi:hypothetical protein
VIAAGVASVCSLILWIGWEAGAERGLPFTGLGIAAAIVIGILMYLGTEPKR